MSNRFINIVRESQEGATLVENTIVLPLLIILIISAIDLLRLGYLAVTLQFVTEAVIREVTISDMTTAQSQAMLRNEANIYGLNVPANSVEICPVRLPLPTSGNPACASNSVGRPGDMLVMQVVFPFQGWIIRDYSIGRLTVNLSSMVMAKRELI